MDRGITYREAQLQNLLSDERSRCDQHKQMYQTLKEKHNRLQEELAIIYEQLKDTRQQNDQFKASKDSLIKKLEETLAEQQHEIRVLEGKVLELSSEDRVQKSVVEVSRQYDEQLVAMKNEADKLRLQYNELHYDYTTLKCKMEYMEEDHSKDIDFLKMKHLSEIAELNEKIEKLEDESKPVQKDYSSELRASEKEILQANSRLRTMLSECEELRAQNERLTVQMDSMARNHSKQLAENTAAIRSIESEKSSALMQREILSKQISSLEGEKQDLSDRLQDAKQEILVLRGSLEDYKSKHEMETANLKIEMQQLKVEHETERERQQNLMDRLQDESNQLKLDIERRKQMDAEREQVQQRQMLSVKQDAWQKNAELERENEKLEAKVKELEIKSREELGLINAKLQKTEIDLQMVMKVKQELQKEVDNLTQRSHQESHLDKDLNLPELLRKQNLEFTREIQQLKEQISQLISNSYVTEPKSSKSSDYEVVQLRLNLEQQNHQHQQHIHELENQVREQKNIANNEKNDLQNKLKQYARLISKLREKIESQKNLIEELEIQNEVLSKNIPFEDHMKLKRKLADIQKKQEEFHEVMNVALPFSHDFYSDYVTLGEHERASQGLSDITSVKRVVGPNRQASDTDILKPLEEITDINLPESLRTKTPKFLSKRRSFQKFKSKSKAMAEYSSSSDRENH